MVQGVIITGGEDSQVLAWSMQEGVPEESKAKSLQSRSNKGKEERYFKPY